jgi:hypothetical protein
MDWTFPARQSSFEYGNDQIHLQFLCLAGIQISLDAFSGLHAQI